MDREEIKQLAELNDKYQEVKAENERLKEEIHQLGFMINNLLGWKTYAK